MLYKDVIPPYISAGEFAKFMDLMRRVTPEEVTVNFLKANSYSRSNAYTLLSALKFMGLVAEDEKVLDRETLVNLGAGGEKRKSTLGPLVKKAYKAVFDTIPIETATLEDIAHFFRIEGVAASLAPRVARLFLWLANEGGIETGEQFQPYNVSSDKPKQKNLKSERANPSEIKPAQGFDLSEDYEEALLKILLNKMQDSKELPSPELIQQVKDLIKAHNENRTDAKKDQ